MVKVKLLGPRIEQHASYVAGDVIDVPADEVEGMALAGQCELIEDLPTADPGENLSGSEHEITSPGEAEATEGQPATDGGAAPEVAHNESEGAAEPEAKKPEPTGKWTPPHK